MNLPTKLRMMFDRELRNRYTIKEFGHANKDFLIIVCDPKTDQLFVSYRDHYVSGKIKGVDGKKTHVMKDMMRFSRFDHEIDGFIASLVETLGIPTFKGNQFYQMVDGFLYNIAQSLRKKRAPVSKGIPSPFVGSSGEFIK